jgi:hypothetical protein
MLLEGTWARNVDRLSAVHWCARWCEPSVGFVVFKAGGGLWCLVAVRKSPMGADSIWACMATAWGWSVCGPAGEGGGTEIQRKYQSLECLSSHRLFFHVLGCQQL